MTGQTYFIVGLYELNPFFASLLDFDCLTICNLCKFYSICEVQWHKKNLYTN